MELKHRAVVMGTNYYIGLAIVRNLGRHNIKVTTMDYEPSPYGISKYADKSLIVPHYQKEEERLVKSMIAYAESLEEKPVLFLSSDPYVEFFDRNFDALKEHYLFPMDQKGLLSSIMDKDSLVNYTDRYGIPTPEKILCDEEDLVERVDEEIGYPCILKPKDSASFVQLFREKAFVLKNKDMLIDRLELVENTPECDTSDCFVQRIVKGPESNCYSADLYYGPGTELKGFLTTEKIRQWPNNFGASTYAKQVWIPELIPLVDPLFQGVKFRGFAEVELKRDERTGVVYLIEINVRFINFTEMLCHLGFETPYMYYMDATGGDIPEKFITYDTDCHWKYKHEDISAVRGYLRTKQMTFGQIVSDYKFKKVNSTWAWDDMGPGFNYFGHLVKKEFSKLSRKLSKKS
ncbi:MAG: carboxylate--amine ligase [Peptoniphilus sp.]|nr:carboxylate--amine ligase [Peptoniphilus sp.]MDD7363503.1 carboxylate--amine ligase [Bacillota bacterium]MDY6044793.1 carboxylate--amine ligase [Peptoniphilus sp.]